MTKCSVCGKVGKKMHYDKRREVYTCLVCVKLRKEPMWRKKSKLR